jgi:hypothetical protein
MIRKISRKQSRKSSSKNVYLSEFYESDVTDPEGSIVARRSRNKLQGV